MPQRTDSDTNFDTEEEYKGAGAEQIKRYQQLDEPLLAKRAKQKVQLQEQDQFDYFVRKLHPLMREKVKKST